MLSQLRLMTWNVRSLRDDREAIMRVLRESAPDVLFVQEAPRFVRAQAKLAALAREAGLVVASGGRPAAGVALLTTLRVDVEDPASTLLTKTARLHQRGFASARLTHGDHSFVAASVHLGLDAYERRQHAREIAQLLGQGQSVIAGDFNETSGGLAWQTLADGRRDVGAGADLPTFSAKSPRRRIDTILVPAAWTVQPISPLEIVDESVLIEATDHLPVIVDVLG